MTRPGPKEDVLREAMRAARAADGADRTEADERRDIGPAAGKASEREGAAAPEAGAAPAVPEPGAGAEAPAREGEAAAEGGAPGAQAGAPGGGHGPEGEAAGEGATAPEPATAAEGATAPERATAAERPATAPEPATAAEGPAAADAADELAALRREREEYLALAQRTQADFENYRKRAIRDNAAAAARAKAGLVREILPVVDNLERALLAAGDGEQTLAAGVRLVLNELEGVLERSGVQAIEAHRETFDPRVHEALSTRVEEGTDAGLVLDVAQKGYRLGDAVIRPARVVVSA